MTRALVLASLLAAVSPALADDTVAATAYNKATELEQQGKWDEACPFYEASYRADPQIGVLLHLAVCHEHVGKLASAFTEFTDAADLAHSRNDPREQTARERAAAIAPKLAKLYLAPPTKAIAGLVVKRDGVDVTALVGANVPVDPGDHEIVATAPGYKPWSTKVTIAAAGTAAVDLPLLEKAPEPAHEGSVKITSQADAHILIDGQEVGIGHYEAKLGSGGHTLRVTAPGKHAYQTDILVGENAERTIDVPLEAEYVAAPVEEPGPSFELGAGLASGVKLKGDRPAIVALRAEAAFRLGRRVNLGVFAEYGALDTGDACGFNMPGAIPTSSFDFGPRNQFQSCTYLMPGLQLYIHVLPKRTIDPYVGITPGFRIGFVDWIPYVGGAKGMETSDVFPAIVTGVRAGVNYHPKPDFAAWEVGAWVESSITIFGKEAAHQTTDNGHESDSFVSVLAGLRSTILF